MVRTDARGRMRTSAARREELLGEFQRSGLSATKFAALAGIKYQTFANWWQKRRKEGLSSVPSKPADAVRWLEAVVQDAQGGASVLIIRLPGGAQAEVADLKQVPLAAALLRALTTPC